ncbi:MAG: FAD-dependent oxidoreductase [Candidatus Micrarchaeota archaeon]|nr:FAD-dependent oxidoreductase [Candidatus Micrarchaeota archaeon]
METTYDVIVVGGGVIGSALLYTLSNFTDVKSVLLLEKGWIGAGSSSSDSNSQTLHIGDIETNYSTEKIIETGTAARLILKYGKTLKGEEKERTIQPVQKMVLGVGDEEVELIEKRYDRRFIELFPHIKTMGRAEIGKVEPMVVKGRAADEKIIAAYSKDGHMVDFGRLANSFIANSSKDGIKVSIGEEVVSIKKRDYGYVVKTNKSEHCGRFVVFAAGGYSLYFAKSLGYGKDLSLLSVGGNFYYSRKVIRGKVYRVQKGSVPFAAVHADVDINRKNITRYGPTVNVVPYLEKSDYESAYKYLKAMGLDKETASSLINITEDKDIQRILESNLVYSVPELGKYFFLKEEVNKIVPTLKYGDLEFFSQGGGIRPQIIDKRKRKLVLGVVDLGGEGIEFCMAPSPGASACLKEGLRYALSATKYLDLDFNKGRYYKMFCDNEREYRILTKPSY